MATAPAVKAREMETKGVGRIGLGAGLGFAGALCAIVIPLAFVFLVSDVHAGFFTFSSTLVAYTSIIVLVGAILLLLSLFFYRRSFSALRKVDRRFVAASFLCIVGTIGFLLILVAAAVVIGNSASLIACAKGHPSHALTCLQSGQPLGALTGILGFVLGWFGGLGIVLGLFLAGSRFQTSALSGAGAVYAMLLLLLLVPFLGLIVTVPGLSDLVIVAPLLGVVGPGLAVAGAYRARDALGRT
jgi:hypothetical protein